MHRPNQLPFGRQDLRTMGDMHRPARPVRPPPSSRRNLFHGTATRRPIPSMTTASTLHLPSEEPNSKDDFVERDSNGNYLIAAPATSAKPGLALRSEMDEEIEQENQLIALYGKENAHWDQNALLEDIKTALQSSVERKVQSLEHDRWMFEGDVKSKS